MNRILDYAKIIEMYKSGANQYEIAQDLKCHQTSIHYILKRNGVEIRKSYFKNKYDLDKPLHVNKRFTEVINLRKEKLTYKQVAERLGVKPSTISNYLHFAFNKGAYDKQKKLSYKSQKKNEREKLIKAISDLSPRTQKVFAGTFPEYGIKVNGN